MNSSLKNVLGLIGFLVIQLFPWVLFIHGMFADNLMHVVVGSFLLIYNKLRSVEELLKSIAAAFVVLVEAKEQMEKGEDNKEDIDSMFR